MTPTEIHDKAVGAFRETLRDIDRIKCMVGRWQVVLDPTGWKPSTKRYSVYFRDGERTIGIQDVCIAINGVDGEVFEFRWTGYPEPTDDEKMEIIMNLPESSNG